MTYGLIGKKLGHSFSKTIHETIADYTYDLIELNEEEFHTFMKEKKFNAINVTIPYKEKVIPYLDELDEKASTIKAVNAIRNDHGKLIGTNTDFDGLKFMIENHFDLSNKIVAICGSGGTSKTALAVCKSLNVKEATDSEIEKYYKENKEQFTIPERVQASHILIPVDTNEIRKNIIEEDKEAEIGCQFCNSKYKYTEEELLELLNNME